MTHPRLLGRILVTALATATFCLTPPVSAETPRPSVRIVPHCDSAVQERRSPVTGKLLPRFESIRAVKANLRRGPSFDHRIDWVIRAQRLPVCVISEIDGWRRVVLPGGEIGWLKDTLVSRSRYAMFAHGPGGLRQSPEPSAPLASEAPAMAPLKLLGCRGEWCALEVEGARRFAPRRALWGVRPVEEAPY